MVSGEPSPKNDRPSAKWSGGDALQRPLAVMARRILALALVLLAAFSRKLYSVWQSRTRALR
jgi:hypothetical protein